MPDLQQDGSHAFRIAGRTSFASYRTAAYGGEYQGYGAVVSYGHPWVHAELALAGYRIVRNGLTDRGLGDLSLDVRGTLYRAEELSLGLEMAATLPTGNADIGLGMGHAMLMPGAWLSYQQQRLQLLVQVAYGRSVGAMDEHRHAETGPLVNPMNRSELEHAVALSYGLTEHLFAGGRLFGAVPVAAVHGAPREAAGVGLGASFAPLRVDLELQLPLVGTPFETRSLLTVAALF